MKCTSVIILIANRGYFDHYNVHFRGCYSNKGWDVSMGCENWTLSKRVRYLYQYILNNLNSLHY